MLERDGKSSASGISHRAIHDLPCLVLSKMVNALN